MPVKRIRRKKLAKPKYEKYVDYRQEATERSNFSGEYFRPTLIAIANVSKEMGIDPYELAAIGLQETGLGKSDPAFGKSGWVYNLESTPFSSKAKSKILSKWNKEAMAGNVQAERNNAARLAAQMLKRKGEIAKSLYGREPSRTEVLQGWQGYGRIPYVKSFGGQKDLIGKRDLPHGKRILEHIKSMKKNPNFARVLGR